MHPRCAAAEGLRPQADARPTSPQRISTAQRALVPVRDSTGSGSRRAMRTRCAARQVAGRIAGVAGRVNLREALTGRGRRSAEQLDDCTHVLEAFVRCADESGSSTPRTGRPPRLRALGAGGRSKVTLLTPLCDLPHRSMVTSGSDVRVRLRRPALSHGWRAGLRKGVRQLPRWWARLAQVWNSARVQG
jgi:hypothetical protein